MNRMYRLSEWADGEIRVNYLQAKNRKAQIKILCALTLLNVAEVCAILRAGGIDPEYQPKRKQPKKGRKLYDWETVLDLYKKGMTDAEIYRETGIRIGTICMWRTREKLPKNTKRMMK
ncbi:MAG: hypothetical protein ABFD76_06725 [Smithella sp.]